MSIFIDHKTKAIVQGITGKHGSFHAKLMRAYGTKIVAGVTPGKGGVVVDTIPVYNSVREALRAHDASWSVIFVPAKFAKAAAFEAIDAGLNILIITENIPFLDSLQIMWKARLRKRIVIGPNCPGVTSVGESKLGIMPNHIFAKGDVGVVSRSGTLTYEIIHQITRGGLGQTTAVGIGGDPIGGVDFIDVLERFEEDPKTKRVVLIGEIGGDFEIRAARYIQEHMEKPVVAYIAGRTAPQGKRMGHAGAVIMGDRETAQAKIRALTQVKVPVARLPSEVVRHLKSW